MIYTYDWKHYYEICISKRSIWDVSLVTNKFKNLQQNNTFCAICCFIFQLFWWPVWLLRGLHTGNVAPGRCESRQHFVLLQQWWSGQILSWSGAVPTGRPSWMHAARGNREIGCKWPYGDFYLVSLRDHMAPWGRNRMYRDGVLVDIANAPVDYPYIPSGHDNVLLGVPNDVQSHYGEGWIDDIISYEYTVDDGYVWISTSPTFIETVKPSAGQYESWPYVISTWNGLFCGQENINWFISKR